MGYDNKVSVTVLNYPNTCAKMNVCPKCSNVYDLDVKFCGKDGTELNETKVYSRVKDIIAKFLEIFTENTFLIDKTGRSTGQGSSDVESIVKHLTAFSKEYDAALFQVDITWDQGFGDPPTRYYIQNGKKQKVDAVLTFEPFDKTKLK
jgi:hypothetical protein